MREHTAIIPEGTRERTKVVRERILFWPIASVLRPVNPENYRSTRANVGYRLPYFPTRCREEDLGYRPLEPTV